MSDDMKDSFAAKFGQKLKSIYTSSDDLEWVCEAFPKIKEQILMSLSVKKLVSIRFN